MLQGSWTAQITPFKDNHIDFDTLGQLLHRQINAGTDGILLLGTTAEPAALGADEQKEVLAQGMNIIGGRVPVMVGCGTNNLEKTLASVEQAAKTGANYALVITPYYNKTTQQGLYLWFKEVAAQSAIPVVIYNVPSRTGLNITAETVCRIARDCPNVVAVKEASGDLLQCSTIIRDAPDGFALLSGEDALNHPLMCVGATGVVSVTSNLLPRRMKQLVNFNLNGKVEAARHLHLDMLAVNRALFWEVSPIPVKAAMEMAGLCSSATRPPLCEMGPENRENLAKVIEQLGDLQ